MASPASHSTFGPLSFGPPPASIPISRVRQRIALLISADASLREQLRETLIGLRWQVREASSGAQAWAAADGIPIEAAIVDSWLPDLDLGEFLAEFQRSFAGVDVLTVEGAVNSEGPRSPYRQELLYALRISQDGASQSEVLTDTAAWNAAPEIAEGPEPFLSPAVPSFSAVKTETVSEARPLDQRLTDQRLSDPRLAEHRTPDHRLVDHRLPDLIGNAPSMLEVSRRVRLVAPRSTPVLIEGPTGSGKELVAQALHRLSPRARKPFVAINCAAIPEALLEAELFGHTRGAFTGATHGRTGRIEAADGGTLFLDEIGEMPLALQAKLLRFVECGELQRVGENESVRVDVRIIAATHQHLAKNASEGNFRSDLYYRLAVFLIRTPSLAERGEDLSLLIQHFLDKMGRTEPVKRIDSAAVTRLLAHPWPGNVRELEHVLERASILAGEAPVITASEIEFGIIAHA
ncbi:sigma-54-dependent transcriptional regulator [Terracidiphilus gabretensis]|uniref:sigma-54-dependent transcriptional regulator n=1 Tax=Terracidiphilus gabretensis TaxID=1577687 RepID=UPI001E467D43|nr:sigma-54 dependent transcriptional regulator [Terracidiphilus gabretensis]